MCPGDWQDLGIENFCYFVANNASNHWSESYEQAINDCVLIGGQLASIHSMKEKDAIAGATICMHMHTYSIKS